MPTKSGSRSPQETAFIKQYVATGDGRYAADQAGYAHPAVAASKALARPAIQEAIREEQLARLHNELLPLATKAVERLLTDPKTPAGAQVQAAKLVFDRTLGATDDGKGKPIEQWSGAELEKALEVLKRERDERAAPMIDVTPRAVDQPESDVFG